MRVLLAETLECMAAGLRAERLAHDACAALLDDSRIRALPPDARHAIAAAAAEHLTAVLTPRELIQYHETLARYGVGTQQEVERQEESVRYVIRLPAHETRLGATTEPTRLRSR